MIYRLYQFIAALSFILAMIPLIFAINRQHIDSITILITTVLGMITMIFLIIDFNYVQKHKRLKATAKKYPADNIQLRRVGKLNTKAAFTFAIDVDFTDQKGNKQQITSPILMISTYTNRKLQLLKYSGGETASDNNLEWQKQPTIRVYTDDKDTVVDMRTNDD